MLIAPMATMKKITNMPMILVDFLERRQHPDEIVLSIYLNCTVHRIKANGLVKSGKIRLRQDRATRTFLRRPIWD